jgi:hypothetical protein
MPYKAAKAVAATFCYSIRWVLTPLFGEDFLSMCIHPEDPNFAKFLIDPAIVRECTEETNQWRTEGVTYKPYRPEESVPANISRAPSSNPTTPRMKFASPPWGAKSSKALYPKPVDQESGYGSGDGTDEAASEKYVFSPEVSPRSHGWTSINGSPSSASLPTFSPQQGVLTSVPGAFHDMSHHSKRTLSKVAYSDNGEVVVLPATGRAVIHDHEEEDVRPPMSGTVVTTTNDDVDNREEYRAKYPHLTEKDFEGAETLLLLSRSGGGSQQDHRTKRSRHNSKH